MTRFASAPWPLKAAYVGVLVTGATAILLGLAAIVALAGLKRLHALPIDLGRVELIRGKSPEQLSHLEDLQALLLQLGLNDGTRHSADFSFH